MNNPLLKYVVKKDPNDLLKNVPAEGQKKDGDALDLDMDERMVAASIPISKFKSKSLLKKKGEEYKIEEFQLSPTAGSALRDIEFKHIDYSQNPSMLSGFKKHTFEATE